VATSVNTVTDIDTPANTAVLSYAADNDITITTGAATRVVSGANFKRAVTEVNTSEADYVRTIAVHDTVDPEEFIQIDMGVPSGILLTSSGVQRRVLYAELVDAIENALNG
jgi:hypothetical protein